ncbi:MAG: hypothetical protein ACYC0H_09180 [Solirubrobacteraceae bacterium]
MPGHRSPDGLSEAARVQHAILNLILDPDRQRPLSDKEIARLIGDAAATEAALAELYKAEIIHRWQQLISATHPAVRYHELAHKRSENSENRHDHLLLELLLEDPEHGHDEATLAGTLAAEDPKLEIDALDALDRLDRAGLIERRGQDIHPARVTLGLDALSL